MTVLENLGDAIRFQANQPQDPVCSHSRHENPEVNRHVAMLLGHDPAYLQPAKALEQPAKFAFADYDGGALGIAGTGIDSSILSQLNVRGG